MTHYNRSLVSQVFDGKPPQMKSGELEKRRESKERAGKELEVGLVQHRELEQHRQHHLQEEQQTSSQLQQLEQKLEKSGIQISPEATERMNSEATDAAKIASSTEQHAQVRYVFDTNA